MPGASAPAENTRAVLSRELSEFLIELSIAVHRFSMYPADHPSLGSAAQNVLGRLSDVFETRSILTIGVAQRQIIVEGVATDPRQPVLADFARRLHDQQVGALSFSKGTRVREIEGVLQALARDDDPEGELLGLLPPDRLPSWEHVQIHPVGYDRLGVRSGEGAELPAPDSAAELWRGLAQVAMASDQPQEASSVPGPNTLARIIEKHKRDPGYDQVIVSYLRRLAEELEAGGGEETAKVRQQVSTLIGELNADTLRRLVKMCGDAAQQRRLVLDANHNLAVEAVIKLLQAAADPNAQTISTSMTRLLSKLAGQAAAGNDRVRPQADTALRDQVEEMVSGWESGDPNPSQYTAILDAMAHASPLFEAPADRNDEGRGEGALRVIQMALEVDAWGTSVEAAAAGMVALGEARALLALVDGAASGNQVAARLNRLVSSPSQLKKLLSGGNVDEGTLQALVTRMGAEAIPPLLDVLSESSSRYVRRKVFDHLTHMGPEVARRAVDRLGDGRWFVMRNMLVLLQKLDSLPEELDSGPLLAHPDPRVRREAIPVALRKREGREHVLAVALAEHDERSVRLALLDLRADLPEVLVPVVVNRVVRSDWSPEIRGLAARALANSRSALALDALIGLCTDRSIFGKLRLAATGPDVLAALRGLALSWAADARGAAVLAQAARSADAEVREAAAGGP